MFLLHTFFDQQSPESVGKKDNHVKSQAGKVQTLVAFYIFFFVSPFSICQPVVP